MSFIITFLALSFVIFIHELGHLLAAKRSNIGVYEFAIGMGPKIASLRFGETDYTLRLFPVGGFVKLAGMDDPQSDTHQFEENRSINAASKWNRFLTISAGSIANVLLGFTIFVVIYSLLGVNQPTTTIRSFSESSPAKIAGLKIGDAVMAINNISVKTGTDVINNLQSHPTGQPITLSVKRGVDTIQLNLIPKLAGDRKIIGVLFETSKTPKRVDPATAIQLGTIATIDNIGLTFVSLKRLVSGEVKPDQMTGIVGIVQIASFGFKQGLANFLSFMAMISISLGIFNLLPLPALDGGHLVLLGLEKLRGRPLNPKWEARVSNVGFAFLIGLMVIILFNDLKQWSARNQLMQSIETKK